MKRLILALLLIMVALPVLAVKMNLQIYYRDKLSNALEYAFRIDNYEATPILISNIKVRVWFYETRLISDMIWASKSNDVEAYDSTDKRTDKLDAFNVNIVQDASNDCGQWNGVQRKSNMYMDIYYTGTQSISAGGYIVPKSNNDIFGNLTYIDSGVMNEADDYSSTLNLDYLDKMQSMDYPYVVLYYQVSAGVWQKVAEVQDSTGNPDLYTGQEPCNTIAPPSALPTPYSVGVKCAVSATYTQTEKLSEVMYGVGSMNDSVNKWFLFNFYKKPKASTLSTLKTQLIWSEMTDFGYTAPTGTYGVIGRAKP